MKVQQLYYTSVRRGMGNGAGFQTYSMSEGISQTEKEEIQKLVGYIPPATLPAQPTTAEIEALFPVSFTYFQLNSGRRGVLQSAYVGQDYSMRFGNYFTHVLLFDEGGLPFYPAELCGSAIFKKRLTEEEEQSDAEPKPLPVLHSVPVNRELSFEKVLAFLGKEGRMESFRQLLADLLDKDSKRFMLLDDMENIPYWFAAVQMAFPKHLAGQLTFTTYTFNPEKSPALICSTWEKGTRFSPNLGEFHMYQLNKDAAAREAKPSDYLDYLIGLLRENPAEVKGLFQFIEQFRLADINQDLNRIPLVYKMTKSGLQGLSQADLIVIFDFIRHYGGENIYKVMLEKLEEHWFADGQWENDLYKLSVETAEAVCSFLFDAACYTNNPDHLGLACKFFYETLDQFILDANSEEAFSAAKTYDANIKILAKGDRTFTLAAIDSTRLKKLNYLTSEPAYFKLHFYLTTILGHFLSNGMQWGDLDKEQQKFLLLCLILMIREGEDVLHDIAVSPDYFAHLIVDYYKRIKEKPSFIDSFDAHFCSCMEKKSKETAWVQQVYSLLGKTKEGCILILKNAYAQVSASNQPVMLLEEMYDSIFSRHDFFLKSMPTIVINVLNLLQPEDLHRHNQLETLFSRFGEYLGKNQVGITVEKYEEGLKFDDSLEDQTRNLIAMEQMMKQVRLNPNKTTGHFVLMVLTGDNLSKKELASFLNRLNDGHYSDFVVWSLPRLTAKLDKQEACDLLYVPEKEITLWNAILQLQKKNNLVKEFVLYCFTNKYKGKNINLDQDDLISKMIEHFQGNKTEFKQVNEAVLGHKMYEKQEINMKINWKKVQDRVGGSDSIFTKVKMLFKK